MKKYLIISLVFFLEFCTSKSNAQSIPIKGKEFWLGTIPNFFDSVATNRNMEIYIITDAATTGSVYLTRNNQTIPFATQSDSTVFISVSEYLQFDPEVIDSYSVKVFSQLPVSVYVGNNKYNTAGVSRIIPLEGLGTSYSVLTYQDDVLSNIGTSEFVIVAQHDNTKIEITPSVNTSLNRQAGIPFQITLQEGQTYLIQSKEDLTGTIVKSIDIGNGINSFALFSGNTCANNDCSYCDHIYEQEYSINTWGNVFLIPSNDSIVSKYRILANTNITNIKINNSPSFVLNAGEHFDFIDSNAVYIESNNPVSVAEIGRGSDCNDYVDGDPYLIYINKLDTLSFRNLSFKKIFTNISYTYFANIVVKTIDTSSVFINGNPVNSFKVFPTFNTYSYTTINLAPYNNVYIESASAINGYVYSFGNDEAIAYSVGGTIKIDYIYSFRTKTKCIGNQIDFTALAPDSAIFYNWNFGDGVISQLESVSHSFSNAGNFNVSLIVGYPSGIQDTVVKTITISELKIDTIALPDCYAEIYGALKAYINPTNEVFNFLWSNGDTTQTILNLDKGIYSVSVNDGFACSITKQITLNDNNSFLLNTSVDSFGCNACSGSITLNPSSTNNNFNFLWANGETTASISNLCVGIYNATITDIVNGNYVFWSDDFNLGNLGWILNTNVANSVNSSESNRWMINNNYTNTTFCPANDSLGYLYITTNVFSTFYERYYYHFNSPNYRTDKLAISPVISTMGKSNIQLKFWYSSEGELNKDYGSVGFSSDGGVTWTYLPTRYSGTPTCTQAIINIPANFENISNFRFAFRWINDGSGGSNIPFRVDKVELWSDGQFTCSQEYNQTINLPNILKLNFTIWPDTGNCSGKIHAIASGGPPPYQYLWSNGDTTASLSSVCFGQYSVTVSTNNGCSLDTTITVNYQPDTSIVWPGDANDDLVANNYDLLPIGLYYGSTGSARDSVSNLWIGHAALNWNDTLYNGSNLNHADCNGDGIINDADTLAINLNYGLTHVRSGGVQSRSGEPLIQLVPNQSTYLPGETAIIDIVLGDVNNPVSNLYGMSFDLSFDYSIAETGSVQLLYPNSFLGNITNNLKLSKLADANAKVFGAITKKNQQNANGYGTIAQLKFIAKNNTSSPINSSMAISNYFAITANADSVVFDAQNINATFVIDAATGMTELSNELQFMVYPNPYTQSTTIEYSLKDASTTSLKIYDVLGRTIMHIEAKQEPKGTYQIPFTNKNGKGVYLVELNVNGNKTTKRIVEVE